MSDLSSRSGGGLSLGSERLLRARLFAGPRTRERFHRLAQSPNKRPSFVAPICLRNVSVSHCFPPDFDQHCAICLVLCSGQYHAWNAPWDAPNAPQNCWGRRTRALGVLDAHQGPSDLSVLLLVDQNGSGFVLSRLWSRWTTKERFHPTWTLTFPDSSS
ncbi:hypothetical protein FKP32DRAFT_877441 [Trametes sanguinea]|nr:hypothetical protein FKP32DRAFT_877441 [Trametes sanguinea]